MIHQIQIFYISCQGILITLHNASVYRHRQLMFFSLSLDIYTIVAQVSIQLTGSTFCISEILENKIDRKQSPQ